MKYSCLLFALFFCSSIYAQGLRDNACLWLFKKSTFKGEARPERVLTGLGLREGTDFSGQKDKSIVVVKRKTSDVSILLSRFQERWPDIQLFYTTERVAVPSIRALMRMGKHVAYVHIPLAFLADYFLLEGHILGLNNNLKKVETLLKEPVDFLVTKMTSLGFDLEIEGFRNRPLDAQLAWMWRRQERHQLSFSFTNHLFEPVFSASNLGLSVGKKIYIADFLLFSDNKNFKAYLAHEIVHSTNAVQFEKYGDVTGQISFYAGKANDEGLFVGANIPEAYKRAFQTDEMEAWLITERLNPESREDAGVSYKDFLPNQIEWLEELRRILPGQLVLNQSPWALLSDAHSAHRVFITAPDDSLRDTSSDFSFVLFSGAPNEVVVVIPRVQSKVEEMGAEAFLLDAINQRLLQLNNRARLAETPTDAN